VLPLSAVDEPSVVPFGFAQDTLVDVPVPDDQLSVSAVPTKTVDGLKLIVGDGDDGLTVIVIDETVLPALKVQVIEYDPADALKNPT
jgi:hypothetical protein